MLISTIADYLSKKKGVYIRHSSFVNLSGTEKSHIVDEVAKQIITVPIAYVKMDLKVLTSVPSFLICL